MNLKDGLQPLLLVKLEECSWRNSTYPTCPIQEDLYTLILSSRMLHCHVEKQGWNEFGVSKAATFDHSDSILTVSSIKDVAIWIRRSKWK